MRSNNRIVNNQMPSHNDLHMAVESGTLDQVKQVLSRMNGDQINQQNKQGQTALHLAVKNGDEELVRILANHGCDLNQGNYSGQTALFLACWNNKPSMVKLLLSFQVNLNIQDNRGWTALMISSYNGYFEIVDQLLRQGADPRVADSFGKRPIDRAKDPQIQKLLQGAADEYQLGGIPPPQQRNSSPPYKHKTPGLQTDEEGSQSSAKRRGKRHVSAQSFNTTKVSPFESKRVKEVESATQLKQLASQLVQQSQQVLQVQISQFVDLCIQKQLIQFEQYLWTNILQKFEQRQYITFDCLSEYLALKLRIAMAHLGIKVPEDLLIDYQQRGQVEFQEGFQLMVQSESNRLQEQVNQISNKQIRESSLLEEKINTIAYNIGISANQGPVVLQHLQQSFQGTCQRLFEQSTDQIQKAILKQCPQVEKVIETRMEEILEKAEREMKKKVEDMVQRCVNDVKEHMNEVDSWIHPKKNSTFRSNQERSSNNTMTLHNTHQNTEAYTSQQISPNNDRSNLHQVFQRQNDALREKVNQLKSALSPKNLK